jgi:hypothetical protein
MCQEYLEEFDSSLMELAAVNARLERQIELNTRYKESVSSRNTSPKFGFSGTDLDGIVFRYFDDERQPSIDKAKQHLAIPE